MAILIRGPIKGGGDTVTDSTLKKYLNHFRSALGVVMTTATALTLILTLCVVSPVRAETHWSREYLVKAAFLYNFAKFVQWPEDILPEHSTTLSLCILGESPLDASLESILDKPVKGKRLRIVEISTTDELNNCQMVFITSSQKNQLPNILRQAGNFNVLTVSDMNGFAAKGGMIGFTMRDNKVRFDINIDAVAESQLNISSQLLKLATIVRNGG